MTNTNAIKHKFQKAGNPQFCVLKIESKYFIRQKSDSVPYYSIIPEPARTWLESTCKVKKKKNFIK